VPRFDPAPSTDVLGSQLGSAIPMCQVRQLIPGSFIIRSPHTRFLWNQAPKFFVKPTQAVNYSQCLAS